MAKQKKPQPEILTHPWERWTPRRILRSQITSADYNPSKISDAARRRLTEGMKKLHLLQGLVWNVRTGVLVGGHKRLRILDVNADGAKDYYLTVSEVDLSSDEEVEANLLLNNQEAMGEVDVEKLRAVFDKHPGMRLEAAGFERVDVMRIFGTPKADVATAEDLQAMGQSLDKMRELASKIQESTCKRDDGLFYLVIIFKDSDASEAFIRHCDLKGDQFQSSTDVLGALRERGLPDE
jgi:hypothetical protein